MKSTDQDKVILQDPRHRFAAPPFEDQEAIEVPGLQAEMNPKAEHGEDQYKSSGKLKGLTALITGGDSGIGRSVAICFAKEGANVAIGYLSETEDAKQTKRLVEACGVQALLLPGDVGDESFCESMIEQTVKTFGGIDVLINNAAFQATDDSIEEFSTESFDRAFKTNVYATFWLSRAAMRHLPPGGSIINTVSIQGFVPSPELLPYASTKSALLGMTKSLAKSAIERGVRVNGVAPGPVWTPLIPSTMPMEQVKNFGANTLFGRPAQPIELAPLYVWLASNDASYVTGEIFGATGGRTPL